jgi:hypothetical protein
MHLIESRILALKNEGKASKEIVDILKKEGVKSPRGRTANYFYVRNTLQRLKGTEPNTPRKERPIPNAVLPANTSPLEDAVWVEAVFNAPLSPEDKLLILKQYYFRLA